MIKWKKFNVDDFVGTARKMLEDRQINFEKLSNSYLNNTAEIIEKHGYGHAITFLEGKFDIEKNYTDEEIKKVLAIRDLVELAQECADKRTFASYLIRSIKPILRTHKEEGS